MVYKYTLYTVQRIKKNDKFYGPIHGSCDGASIICNDKIELGPGWYILNNTFDGEITCKNCLKILEETKYYHELHSGA